MTNSSNGKDQSTYSRLRRFTSIWTYIFFITFLVQLYRHELADVIIFAIASLILFLESSQTSKKLKNLGLVASRYAVDLFIGLSFIILIFCKRESAPLLIYFLALGPIMILVMWSGNATHIRLGLLEFKSALFWSFSVLALILWELATVILSRLAHDDSRFPTLSELTFPLLNSTVVKTQFIIIWLLVGRFLILKRGVRR